MKVIVKKILGNECVVDIMPTNTVLELKNKLKGPLATDVPHQRLLFNGKILADENTISFYPGIKEGSKLHVIHLKKPEKGSSNSKLMHEGSSIQIFRSELSRVLRHYYTESETELIMNELIKDLKHKVNNLSYDDLERLATALLQDQENLA